MFAGILPVLFVFGSGQTAVSAPQEPSVGQVITRLQSDLEAFESALPDFVCEEKITSQNWRGEKLRSQTANESHFSARRNSGSGATVSFAEVRTTHTVNSKKVPPGRKLKGPVLFRNLFVRLLHDTVSPRFARLYDFELAGREALGGQTALVVAYSARSDQQSTGMTINNRFTPVRTTGKIWVDAISMRVLRMTCFYPGVRKSFDIAVSIDYSAVDIGGSLFCMPRIVRTESPEKNPKKPADRKNRVFIAEYSEYRKFNVNSTVIFDEP